ncbi:MAG: TVP38/TMEM64 family protein [Nanoarchaeota archaeon]
MERLRKRDIAKFISLIILIIVFLGIVIYFNLQGHINIDIIQDEIKSYGGAAPIAYIVIYIIALVTFFPITLLTILGAILFGSIYGSIYSTIGALIGAIIAFYIARFLGKRFVDNLTEIKFKRIKKYNQQIAKNGFAATFVARISPVLHYSGLSYLLGLTRVRFWDYFWGSFIGIAVWIIIVTYLSDSLVSLKPTDIIISSILFVILIFILPIYHYIKKYIRYLTNKKDNNQSLGKQNENKYSHTSDFKKSKVSKTKEK